MKRPALDAVLPAKARKCNLLAGTTPVSRPRPDGLTESYRNENRWSPGQRSEILIFTIVLVSIFSSLGYASNTKDTEPNVQNSVLKDIDLTTPFDTLGKWQLVVRQGPSAKDKTLDFAPDFYQFCFEERTGSNLAPSCWPHSSDAQGNKLLYLAIIGKTRNSPKPVLIVQTNNAGDDNPFPGGHVVDTMIWVYDRQVNRFQLAFTDRSNPNTNEATELVTSGVLAGDVIVASQGHTKQAILLSKSPYSYGIGVYRLSQTDQYVRILYFAGKTTYGNGDPRPVIESDMPDILRLLHIKNP